MRRALTIVVALAFAAPAAGQNTGRAAGTLEVGFAPIGGMFFVGGDDDREVDFNVYTAGGTIAYYLTNRVAVEGELAIGLGLGQDITFRQATVFHAQLPHVWSYSGNIVFFPTGAAGRALQPYVTGGIGVVSLQSRDLTGPFGYDKDTVGFQSFIAENIGGGVEIFRSAAPNWGFRADYRYVIVNGNDEAPEFFANAKTRGGHRVYFGVLFAVKH
jgi:hypothetical protein